MLVKDGHAYLVDFGLSRLHDDVKGFSSSRETGNAHWIAPERCLDVTEKATKFSDIYEFASVFYEVRMVYTLVQKVVGHIIVFLQIWKEDRPWGKDQSQFVILAINKGTRPPRPSNMPEDYWNFISKCWDANSERRPSADKALASISRFLEELVDN